MTGAADEIVTYIEGGVEKIYEPEEDTDVLLNAAGTAATLPSVYGKDDFDFANFDGLKNLDASAVDHALKIYGNANANKITGTGDDDYIDGGAGKDILSGGAGKDTLVGGKGNDSLSGGSGNDSLWGGAGNDTLTGGDGKDIFVYRDGDGSDVIADFDASADKIRVLSGDVNSPTVNSAGDVTFAVGSGKIVIKNGADKYIPVYDSGKNILMKYNPPATNSWTLSGTTAKYGSLVTVKGVTSLDGLSLSGSTVTVSASSLGTNKVSISDGYTLKLGSDVDKPSTKKFWTLNKTTATYKQTTSAGYSLDDNSIVYTKAATETLAVVSGVTSLDGLSVSGSTIKLAGYSLSSKVTVSGEYTFDFASDYSKATITGSSSDDTIIARGKKVFVKGGKGSDIFQLKSTGTIGDYDSEDKISLSSAAEISTDGDDLIFNGKVTVKGGADEIVTYIEGGAEKIYKKTAGDDSSVKFNAAGTSVTLTVNYTEDKFDAADYVSSLVTINAAAVPHPLTILGNKNTNKITGTSDDDYIDGLAGGDIINGGKGDDTLIGGTGNDSLVGGAGDDSLVGGTGNDSLNGGAGNDTLWGGAGNDTLFGGDGEDVFIYEKGDGKDVISDYTSVDTVIILSGKVESPFVKGADVTFQIGTGQLIFPNSSNKYIYLLDDKGYQLAGYIPR